MYNIWHDFRSTRCQRRAIAQYSQTVHKNTKNNITGELILLKTFQSYYIHHSFEKYYSNSLKPSRTLISFFLIVAIFRAPVNFKKLKFKAFFS